MNISGLFNNSLRLLLDENSISRVNGLAGKGLKLILHQLGKILTVLLLLLTIITIMVIFKCLSLKALSTLQDHERGGGMG